jgi:hypothetical protein
VTKASAAPSRMTAWRMPGMHYSWLWATVFTLQAVLLVVAGIVRSDLVIRPRWDLASGSGLGARGCFHHVRAHREPARRGARRARAARGASLRPLAVRVGHVLLRPAAMGQAAGPEIRAAGAAGLALGAAPPEPARGVAPDYGMLVAALVTAALIIWRDRASSPAWQTVTAGLLLALMIAWSGHEDVLTGLAVILVVVTLTQAIRGQHRPPRAEPVPSAGALPS